MNAPKTVYVCVGSSCHVKGSYKIIELMRKAIAEHQLEDKVILKAAFCLGNCAEGVNIRIDGKVIGGVNEENFRDIFDMYILA